jgi:hypothetical protein
MRRMLLGLALGLLTLSAPAQAQRLPVTGGHAAPGAPQGATLWLFAEGYTGVGFEEYLTLLNERDEPAHVHIEPLGTDAPAAEREIEPSDRLTIRASTLVGNGREHGFLLRSDVPIVAERATYFAAWVGSAGQVDGGHSALGATSAARRWLFAEGFTGGGFQEYLSLVNPSVTETAHVVVWLHKVRIENDLPPRARATLDVNAAVGPDQELGAEVSSSVPIVAERPIYFSRQIAAAGHVDGGHVALGATAPSEQWWFAEGYTGAGFQEYLAIVNPSDSPTSSDVTAFLENGDLRRITVGVSPHGRSTIDVVRMVGAGHEVALRVAARSGVLAERPSYFRRPIGAAGPIDGGHDAFGAKAPAPTWLFAEGHTGGAFQEYLTVLNPGPKGATVPVRVIFPTAPPAQVSLDVPALSRRTLDVRSLVPQPSDIALVVGPA